ncbi:MAG: UTP--glucose-1-phosphate uridylyltransferase [Clostridia bacterium]|nr:UTP--glucose-1-phosphate uridylyltransferase [Clostridia bacterium]
MNKYRKVVKLLKKYDQEHLLLFYDSLTSDEKNILLDQIIRIDFEKLLLLYHDYQKEVPFSNSVIEPLEYIQENMIESDIQLKYIKKGEQMISSGELAVVTLAGGQGTRLGLKLPKGCFEIETEPRKSLFQIQCENLQRANAKYNTKIHWYIMTSPDNDEVTQKYFNDKNYFGYPKEKITFFKQNTLPVVDYHGKLILDKLYKVKEVSNGNGDVFISLKENGFIKKMELEGIKYVHISGIDNVILKTVDPLLIGLCSSGNYKISSKTVTKNENESNEWVFARKDGKPSIVSSKRITEEMNELKDEEGRYIYRETNILSHLFSLEALKYCSNLELPYHLAEKRNDYINEEGVKVMPRIPNTYKFEQFIFDSFSYFDTMLLLNVKREEEFAPIKSFTGEQTPEKALELYLQKERNRN